MKYYEATSTGELRPIESNGYFNPVITIVEDLTISPKQGRLSVNVNFDGGNVVLPKISASIVGSVFTVRNAGADGAFLIGCAPATGDKIVGTVGEVQSSGVLNKKFLNTKATSNNADFVVLEATALTTWSIVGGVGVWASEA